ncbi:MAG: hypothetical protein GOVbin4162_28 [Prokaryotic dsDNA virus sp.]|nr:MAG: hypothetical protein GOVbin4162_28 [Prokaryotic dsDNA virus sp.]|tara:strand:- start:2749 stop:3213 length:465 start_codon:yes stop_codon:yes gene_type:complete
MSFNLEKLYRKTNINNKEYTIKLLKALPALRMGKTLMSVVLPAVGGTIDGLRDDGYGSTPKTFTELALVLCDQLGDIELDELAQDLLGGMLCNGIEVTNIDDHFQGEIDVLVELLAFALKENFGKLFMGKGLLAQFQKVTEGLMGGGSQESEES